MRIPVLLTILCATIGSCASTQEPWAGEGFYAVSPSRGGFYLKEKGKLVKFEDGKGWIAISGAEFLNFYHSRCGQ